MSSSSLYDIEIDCGCELAQAERRLATGSTAGNASSAGGGGAMQRQRRLHQHLQQQQSATALEAATLTIPQGASVQGNPSYDPDATYSKGRRYNSSRE